MTIKAIVFDLDDTLLWDERSVQEAFQTTCAFAAERYPELDPARLEAEVRREARALYESFETFPFTQRIGINPFEGLWANFTEGQDEMFRKLERLAPEYRRQSWTRGLRACGIDDEALGETLGEHFARERRRRPYVYDDTFAVLTELKKDFQLLLLTNGTPDLQKEKIAGVAGLADYFTHIVISGEFGDGKPAEAIFHHVMKLAGISPQEGLMVGDKLTTDILGANRSGMRSVWINRHGAKATGGIEPAFEIGRLSDLIPLVKRINAAGDPA